MNDIIRLDSVEQYGQLFGLETLNPLVGVVNLDEATRVPERFAVNYGLYALFLKDTKCGPIRYGRQQYDYDEGTVVSFAPGQVAEIVLAPGVRPNAHGLLFHPDLLRGTSLGREIKQYTFLSYSSNEALHLSQDERNIFMDCLQKIKMELLRPIDKHSRRLITKHIELLMDYCLRFYERQFITRASANKDVLIRFEELLDGYFSGDNAEEKGLPSVRYFADLVCLSPNYFGDLIKKETGLSPQEHIQRKIVSVAKDTLAASDMSASQVAYELGFQYPQHFTRLFKKHVGCTPLEYRRSFQM